MTASPSGAREGLSPSPFERGGGRARQGARSPGPGPAEAARPTPRSGLEGAPSQQQEHGRQPARRPTEQPNPAHGGAGQNPAQGHDERIRFGTPAPLGAAEHQQRGTGAPSGFRQQVAPPAGGGNAGEARAQRERMQAAHGQPPRHNSTSRHNSGSKVARLPQLITARHTGSRKVEIRSNQKKRQRQGSINFSAVTPAAPRRENSGAAF